MNYLSRLENKLGFDKIRGAVEAGCSTNAARSVASDFTFMTDEESIRVAIEETDEMRVIQMLESGFPNYGYVDTIGFLRQLETEQYFLDTQSLFRLRQSLEATGAIIRFFKGTKEASYPYLKRLAEPVVNFPEVSRRIDVIVDKYGEIRDGASPGLLAVRREIKEKEGQISKRITAILKRAQADGLADEDSSVSVRDGRVLIPVSAANKRKIPGFVVDESSSGKTVFIEPMEIVELNNVVKELYFAEQREILKILVEFSDFLRPYAPDLIISAEFLSKIDFIRAKSRVAISMSAGKPILTDERLIRIVRGRHPLLEKALSREGKEIVPLNLELSGEKRILLISGPNAGGKSVCLKTVGILQYMLQSGMLVPASEISEFPLFTKIFIDIGDEQSIENDLSTYSSHLTNMREVLLNADEKSLVLVDEFGAGTEPTAGGAIAESILKELEERGCFGVITTHYSNLKFYAGTSRGVINGGMQFDVQNIKPLFKLETGVPGSSFAFELAKKIGLPQEIVKYAEERAGGEFIDLERNLKKIARNRRMLDEKLARIKTTDRTLESITEKYEKELLDIKALRKTILAEAREEAGRLLAEANKKIEATIKEIRESQADKEKTRFIRKDLEEFASKALSDSGNYEQIERKMEQLKKRKERREERRVNRTGDPDGVVQKIVVNETKALDKKISAGDKIKLKGSDLTGEVIRVEGKDVSVAIGNIISKLSLEKVEKISVREFKETSRAVWSIGSSSASISERKLNFKPTIDVRGQRADEALENVSRFVDDAIMVGVGEVKILHGKGNGILKEEIRKYLKVVPGVLSVKDEVLELGGSGITVVKLD
ncbi:MAG: Smr/MutS family protein [Bacteroidales bacterium]